MAEILVLKTIRLRRALKPQIGYSGHRSSREHCELKCYAADVFYQLVRRDSCGHARTRYNNIRQSSLFVALYHMHNHRKNITEGSISVQTLGIPNCVCVLHLIYF